MLPPKGLTGIPEGHVLKFKNSLYCLKQSPRNFNKDLNTTLLDDLGFSQCTSDTCIYTKTVNNLDVYAAVLYLAIQTRPDITYAVYLVAKHCVEPLLEAIHACNRILSYISFTRRLGLKFYAGNVKLTTFVDSSFSDIPEGRKSTGGLI